MKEGQRCQDPTPGLAPGPRTSPVASSCLAAVEVTGPLLGSEQCASLPGWVQPRPRPTGPLACYQRVYREGWEPARATCPFNQHLPCSGYRAVLPPPGSHVRPWRAALDSGVPSSGLQEKKCHSSPQLPQVHEDAPLYGWEGSEAGKAHTQSKCGQRPQGDSAPGTDHGLILTSTQAIGAVRELRPREDR